MGIPFTKYLKVNSRMNYQLAESFSKCFVMYISATAELYFKVTVVGFFVKAVRIRGVELFSEAAAGCASLCFVWIVLCWRSLCPPPFEAVYCFICWRQSWLFLDIGWCVLFLLSSALVRASKVLLPIRLYHGHGTTLITDLSSCRNRILILGVLIVSDI